MRNYLFLILTLALFTACEKAQLIEGKTNGFAEVNILALPGTPAITIYIDDVKKDSIDAGQPGYAVYLLSTGKHHIAFRDKETDALLGDTLMEVPYENRVPVRFAYSEDLGIKGFLPPAAPVHPDSVNVQFTNGLTTLHPDDVVINAHISDEQGRDLFVLRNLAKNKLHPGTYTMDVDNNDGLSITYQVKLENAATGELLTDESNRSSIYMSFYMLGGTSQIAVIKQAKQRGKQSFGITYVAL